MRRVLALYLPDLGIDLARRRRRRAERPEPGSAAPLDVGPPAPRKSGGRSPQDRVRGSARRADGRRPSKRPVRSARWPHPGSPILLTESVAGRTLVVARCPSAAARGVRAGLTVAEARALLAPAQPWIEEHRADRDARALTVLGEWAVRFTPTVALDPPDGLLLDLAGLERLAGDEERHARRILEATARLGLNARAAVAGTVGAAWGLARFGRRSPAHVPSGQEEAALGALPIEALRLPPETCDGLRELSVERLEHLLALERSRVAARFGGDVLLRLDQALGRAWEAVTPLRPHEPPEVERAFEGPVKNLEAVLLTSEELVHELCEELAGAGIGATEIALDWFASDRRAGTPRTREVLTFGRASANPRHLWNVARPRAERMPLGYGIERVRVVARRTARLPREQGAAFGASTDEASTGREHGLDQRTGELVDLLVARLGPEAVRVPHAVETHVPERAFTTRAVTEWLASGGRSGEARVAPGPRPSLLLPGPEAAEWDGDTLRWRGASLSAIERVGPERIARPWWEARADVQPHEARDYERVFTAGGRVLWTFEREGRTFIHGEWV